MDDIGHLILYPGTMESGFLGDSSDIDFLPDFDYFIYIEVPDPTPSEWFFEPWTDQPAVVVIDPPPQEFAGPNDEDDPVFESYFEPWTLQDIGTIIPAFGQSGAGVSEDGYLLLYPSLMLPWVDTPIASIITAPEFDYAIPPNEEDDPEMEFSWEPFMPFLENFIPDFHEYEINPEDDPVFEYSIEPWTFIPVSVLDVPEFDTGNQVDRSDPDPDPFESFFDHWEVVSVALIDPPEFDTGNQVDRDFPEPDSFDYSFETWQRIEVTIIGEFNFDHDNPQVEPEQSADPYEYLFDPWTVVTVSLLNAPEFIQDGWSIENNPPELFWQSDESPKLPDFPNTNCNVVVGEYYQFTFTVSGGTGPYTWILLSGSFPPGLTLSTDGVLSGIPTEFTGTYDFTVQVTDSLGNVATITCSFEGSTDQVASLCICPSPVLVTTLVTTVSAVTTLVKCKLVKQPWTVETTIGPVRC